MAGSTITILDGFWALADSKQSFIYISDTTLWASSWQNSDRWYRGSLSLLRSWPALRA